MKRTIPLLITFLGGIVLILSYFVPHTQGWGEVVTIWFNIIAAIAFVLGGGNLVMIHLKKISDRSVGWGYSAVTLFAFFITLAVGLFKVGVAPAVLAPDARFAGDYLSVNSPFEWIYEYALKPLTATMFAMLAFYIASAAFRAFRAKNVEATLLLVTAFIILLGRTAAGYAMTNFIENDPNNPLAFFRIENLTTFIMNVFNTAGNRAIMIGIALGVASTSLKVILGVDRSYLGSGQE